MLRDDRGGRSATPDAGGGVVGASREAVAARCLNHTDPAVSFGDDLAQGGCQRLRDALPFECGPNVPHVAGRRVCAEYDCVRLDLSYSELNV